jgi:hypothetical protein
VGMRHEFPETVFVPVRCDAAVFYTVLRRAIGEADNGRVRGLGVAMPFTHATLYRFMAYRYQVWSLNGIGNYNA